MNDLPGHPAGDPARLFDLVADAYDRSRPGYPDDAVAWALQGAAGSARPRVVELGAGTGKLTEQLVRRGCEVTATDPSAVMLERLSARAPQVTALRARAEELPLPSRSADIVVAAQAFHWFDADRAVREAARVLRPGGRLAVMWSARDERVPWVRRLGRVIGTPAQQEDPTAAVDEAGVFETVERRTFRFWQPMTASSLRDLVASRSVFATMTETQQERVLRQVDQLYEEYGRGHDGMLLPYVTTVCRTAVLPWAVPAAPEPRGGGHDAQPPRESGPDRPDDDLLIDFR